MTNKDIVSKEINKLGYQVGILSDLVDSLSKTQLKNIMRDLEQETMTYRMIIKGKKLLVELETVFMGDGIIEKDITIKSLNYYDY